MDFVGLLTLVTVGILFVVFLGISSLILEGVSVDDGCGCIVFIGGIGVFIFWLLPQVSSFIVSVRRFWSATTDGISSLASNSVDFLVSLFPFIILILLVVGLGFLFYRRVSEWSGNLSTIRHERAYQLQEKSKIGDDGELDSSLNFDEIIKGRGTEVSNKFFLEEGIYKISCKVKRGKIISISVLATDNQSKKITSLDFTGNASYPLTINRSGNYVLAIKAPNDEPTKWEIMIRQT